MSSIDWEKTRERLAAGREALQQAFEGDPSRLYEMQRRRAEGLAGHLETSLPTVGFLVFWLGERRHAIALEELAGVRVLSGCTRLPGAPPQLLGVISHRGRVLPLHCLGRLLGLPSPAAAGPGAALILRRSPVAARVDSLDTVLQLQPRQVTPLADSPPVVEGLGPEGLVILSGLELCKQMYPREERT